MPTGFLVGTGRSAQAETFSPQTIAERSPLYRKFSIIIKSSPQLTSLEYTSVVPSGENLGPQNTSLNGRSPSVRTAGRSESSDR